MFEKICYQPIDFNINCLKFQIYLKQTFEKSGKYYFAQKVLFKKVEGQKRATFWLCSYVIFLWVRVSSELWTIIIITCVSELILAIQVINLINRFWISFYMIKKKPHTWPRRRMVKILDDPIRNFGPLKKKVANETVTEKPQVFERNFTLRAAENFSTRSIIDLWVCRRFSNFWSLQL